MKIHRQPDYILLAIIGILVAFGLIMVASASVGISQEKFGESYYYFKNQVWRGLLPGIGLGLIAYILPLKFWKKMSLPIFLVCVIATILIFIPGIGVAHGGAKRWINLGFTTFQPSEFLKLGFIIYLAAWLSAKGKAVKNFSEGLIPFVILVGVIGLLIILQPDFGTLGVIGMTALAMFFFAGARFSHLSLIGVSSAFVFWILTKLFSHASNRLQVFLNPELDPKGIGYQINQALVALGSGGIFGVGLGQSVQKFKYLPEPATDSIVAVIGEELGFIGIFCLLLLFLIFVARGLKICRDAPDEFSRLLGGGIIAWITFQAIINIAAICGLLPLTGIPLPFISLGGSSLIMTLTGVGILLNISKHSPNSRG